MHPPFARKKRCGFRKLGAIGVSIPRLVIKRLKSRTDPRVVALCLQRIAYSVSTPIKRDRIGRSFSALMRIAFFQILVRFRLAIFPNPNHRTFNGFFLGTTIVTIYLGSNTSNYPLLLRVRTWQRALVFVLHFEFPQFDS